MITSLTLPEAGLRALLKQYRVRARLDESGGKSRYPGFSQLKWWLGCFWERMGKLQLLPDLS